MDGPTKYEGTLEVYHNGEWGRVCDDYWDLNDVQVVCRELGFGNAIATRHTRRSFSGQGHSKVIWLDNLECVGTEWTIGNCLHKGWNVSSCYNWWNVNVGVKCATG